RAAVGVDGDRTVLSPPPALDRGDLEGRVAIAPERLAHLVVVEGREGVGEVELGHPPWGVDDELVEALQLDLDHAEGPQPVGRDPAGGRRAGADLVSIEDEDVGSGPGKLTGDGEAAEAGAADDDVIPTPQRVPVP